MTWFVKVAVKELKWPTHRPEFNSPEHFWCELQRFLHPRLLTQHSNLTFQVPIQNPVQTLLRGEGYNKSKVGTKSQTGCLKSKYRCNVLAK